MGSSVIHGGVSTFLAIIVLAAAKSYVFVVFFRLWVGIIAFGMSNGFILLPIILSIAGPVDESAVSKVIDSDREVHADVELADSQKSETERNIDIK